MNREFRSIQRLFYFGLATMVCMVGAGIYTANWTVIASGIFSAGLIVFSMRKLMVPIAWVKKVGAPADFDVEARSIQDRYAPLLPWQKPKKRLKDIRYPLAALVAERITRSEEWRYQRVTGMYQSTILRHGLRFLDEKGGYDISEAAEVGIAYVGTARTHGLSLSGLSFEASDSELAQFIELTKEGMDAESIAAYLAKLTPSVALQALQAGVPLELAQALFLTEAEHD